VCQKCAPEEDRLGKEGGRGRPEKWERDWGWMGAEANPAVLESGSQVAVKSKRGKTTPEAAGGGITKNELYSGLRGERAATTWTRTT